MSNFSVSTERFHARKIQHSPPNDIDGYQNKSENPNIQNISDIRSCESRKNFEQTWTLPETYVCDKKKIIECSTVSNTSCSKKVELPIQKWDTIYSATSGQSSQSSFMDKPDAALCSKPSLTNSKSFRTHRDAPGGSSDENVKPSRKSRNTNSLMFLEQLLSKRQSNNSARTKALGNTNEEVLSKSVQNSTFSTKKLENQELPSSVAGVQQAQVKTKIRSVWNNMKYGWRMKREVNLKVDSAIWLLGRCYHNKLNDSILSQDVAKQLKLDLLSKIWLTYRINFPAIPGTDLVSDTGWGCMLRSGQMMMAQALVCHFLHRDWRLSSDQSEEKKQLYKMILQWFGDCLSQKSPFSVHHLVSLGEHYGRKAGDWYGPTHAAHVLRDALTKAKKDHPPLRNLCMYVASDGIVFKQDVLDLCEDISSNELSAIGRLSAGNVSKSSVSGGFITSKEILPDFETNERQSSGVEYVLSHSDISKYMHEHTEEMRFENPCPSYSEYGPPSYSTVETKWKSLILFVSVRLGNDKINPFYIPCLKSLLAYEHCIGIIGGRPKHALYFIGWQDDKLIHMDPHSCQPAIDVEKDDFNEKSFHSSSVRTMSFTEMDPSCAIGFYFREKNDFQVFVDKFSEITAPMKRNLDYPVFALVDGKRVEVEDNNALEAYESCTLSHTPNNSCKDDDDDYILL